MRRPVVLALGLVLALPAAGAGTALAGVLAGPQKRIVPADQARAQTILIRAQDVGYGFSTVPLQGEGQYSCAALDESDLILTGDARSPMFTRGLTAILSTAQVYRSRREADASWRRGTSPQGVTCARAEMARQVQGSNARIVSFRKFSLPRLAERRVAYRIVAARQGVKVYMDLVGLQQSRAQASFFVMSVLEPPPRDEVVRLSRLTARRMAKAMRSP